MKSGEYLRREIAAEAGGTEIDGAVMCVIFYDNYNEFSKYLSIDSTLSLKRQYTEDKSSYFELFMDIAKSDTATLLAENKAASELGITLTDEEKVALESRAASHPMAAYPEYITSNDVLKVMTLRAVAAKYKQIKKAELVPTEEAVAEYFLENGDNYKYVDMMAFSICYSDSETENGESLFDSTVAAAYADKLAESKDKDAFIDTVNEIITAGTPDISDEERNEYISALLLSKRQYSQSDETLVWAFSASTGECRTVHDSEAQTYTVYQLSGEPYTDDSPTKNFRMILLSDTDFDSHQDMLLKASELHSAFLESGSMASFELAALEYSTDSMSYSIGGIFENVKNGIMLSSFNDWIFADGRKNGDSDIIEIDGGCAIIIFEDDGLPTWEAEVTDDMVNERYTEHCRELEAATPIVFDEPVLDMIDA